MIRKMKTVITFVCLLSINLSSFASYSGTDTADDYANDKETFIDVVNDLIPRSSVSTGAQARSVWYAIGERFRRKSWKPSLYDANGAWCTEFVTYAYQKAGMKIKGRKKVSNSRKLAYCLRHIGSKAKVTFNSNSSYRPRPGDAVFFYSGPSSSSYGSYNGHDCTKNKSLHSFGALYCSTHTGMVVGVDGNALVTVEGNIGGRVTIKRRSNYKSSTSIVAFGQIKSNTIDCRSTRQ